MAGAAAGTGSEERTGQEPPPLCAICWVRVLPFALLLPAPSVVYRACRVVSGDFAALCQRDRPVFT